MTRVAVNVLKSVRIAEGGGVHGREIVAGTSDQIPASLFDGLKDAGYVVRAAGAATEEDEAIDLSTLTRAELDALAAERGVDISDAKNKGDVIAALELAAEAVDA